MPSLDTLARFDDRYTAFLQTVTQLRPQLHRYCARMTGSVLDGEDLVQEVLFEAYCKLEIYDMSRSLSPWLFRIAHNRCIDLIRKRGVREDAETAAATMEPDRRDPINPAGPALDRAIERLVIDLPPKERACVLLKDVFDYTLEEVAELVGSTAGGVKAALHRGRGKLAGAPEPTTTVRALDPATADLVRQYIERFNRHDWDGVRELTSADARLRVANCYAGKLTGAPYFAEYETAPRPWKLVLGAVDGEPVVVVMFQSDGVWAPESLVRLDIHEGRIEGIRDYLHCPWIFEAAYDLHY